MFILASPQFTPPWGATCPWSPFYSPPLHKIVTPTVGRLTPLNINLTALYYVKDFPFSAPSLLESNPSLPEASLPMQRWTLHFLLPCLTYTSLFPSHLWFLALKSVIPDCHIKLTFYTARSLGPQNSRCHFIRIVLGPNHCSWSTLPVSVHSTVYAPSTPFAELITSFKKDKFQTLQHQTLCLFHSLLHSRWQALTYTNLLLKEKKGR